MADDIACELSSLANNAAFNSSKLSIALSGGNTPLTLFTVMGAVYSSKTDWRRVEFYWSDERCVPPESHESNFRTAREAFFDKARIPSKNIHRIKGEEDPVKEAERYSDLIRKRIPVKRGLPAFDVILLGLGEDGHTASLFPGDEKILESYRICEVSEHPATGQKRITLTLPVINNAERVIFMVSGRNKAEIVAEILNNSGSDFYPASLVAPWHGKLYWYLDTGSASLLGQLA